MLRSTCNKTPRKDTTNRGQELDLTDLVQGIVEREITANRAKMKDRFGEAMEICRAQFGP